MRAVVMGCWLLGWTMLSGAIAGSDVVGRFRLDPAASLVWFDADARLHTFRGQTRQVHGAFVLTQISPPQIAAAQVSIDAASIATGNTERDADMRQDYLEVATYPTIRFTVLELSMARPAAGGNAWDVVLKGQLTIHGVTRDVQVPTTVSLASQGITAQGQIYLDMRDFKIRVPRLLLIPMKSEVLVGFEVLARPEP